jgi:hypothetical protein
VQELVVGDLGVFANFPPDLGSPKDRESRRDGGVLSPAMHSKFHLTFCTCSVTTGKDWRLPDWKLLGLLRADAGSLS